MGILTLSGSNGFSGGTTIYGGALAFSATAAVPGTGAITIGPSGALVATPIYNPAAPVSSWLAGVPIAANPTGAIALPGGTVDNESIGVFGHVERAVIGGNRLGHLWRSAYHGGLDVLPGRGRRHVVFHVQLERQREPGRRHAAASPAAASSSQAKMRWAERSSLTAARCNCPAAP